MGTKVKPVPEGFHTVTPHLVIRGAIKAIDFYKKAFGAEEVFRMPSPDGKSIMHAELRIGDSVIMLGEEWPGMDRVASPEALKGTTVCITLYTEDADKLADRAVKAGAKISMPLMDAFWGDRYGKVTDPFGHEWGIATHKEDVSPEDCAKRAAAFFANQGGEGCGGPPPKGKK